MSLRQPRTKAIRTIAFSIAGLAGAALVGTYLFRPEISGVLFKRAVQQNMDRDTLSNLSDGLHLGLCGTGSPMPNADRAGPCNIVIAGKQVFIVDIGEGGNRNINLMGVNQAEISAVFLTHYHSDHIDGLGPLQLFHWTRGATPAPLPVYGPQGLDAIIDGFNAAYTTDDAYRVAHHGEEVVPPSGGGSQARSFTIDGDSLVVFENDELSVTAFTVDHHPVDPAVGYRFDYKGRSLCISGDTKKSLNLERNCKGVDILLHEALQPALVKEMEATFAASGNTNAAKIMFDIVDYHASPVDAAKSAQETGASMLVLSHLVPPMPSAFLYPTFLGDAENHFDEPIIVGEDGMLFSLPAHTKTIEQADLL